MMIWVKRYIMSNWIREAKYVEEKFLSQLDALGWECMVIGDDDNKYRTNEALLGRTSFKRYFSKTDSPLPSNASMVHG